VQPLPAAARPEDTTTAGGFYGWHRPAGWKYALASVEAKTGRSLQMQCCRAFAPIRRFTFSQIAPIDKLILSWVAESLAFPKNMNY
jgi:hypothetical protein